MDELGCTCGASHSIKTNKKRPLALNASARRDPTRTLALRDRFLKDMRRRFRELELAIQRLVVEQDVFGLGASPTRTAIKRLEAPKAPGPRAFAFERDDVKVTKFMEWLKKFQATGILQVIQRPGQMLVEGGTPWTDTYIHSAYQQGIQRGREELRRAGVSVPSFSSSGLDISAAMNNPIHAGRLGNAFTRTFTGLQGITAAMDTAISSTLAQGLADGVAPAEISRRLRAAINLPPAQGGVRTISPRQRADMLSRTEVIRAHHISSIQEYRAAGIEGVKVQAEWLTAGDLRVCPKCLELESKDVGNGPGVYSLQQIEPMIPAHPNCRCVALPMVDAPKPKRKIKRR